MSPMNKVMVTLSQAEWNRAIVLQRVVEGQLLICEAAQAGGRLPANSPGTYPPGSVRALGQARGPGPGSGRKGPSHRAGKSSRLLHRFLMQTSARLAILVTETRIQFEYELLPRRDAQYVPAR